MIDSGTKKNKHYNFESLKMLADGDEQYFQELKEVFIRFFDELKKEYQDLMISGDAVRLSTLAHRVYPTLEMLEITSLEEEIKKGQYLLTSETSVKVLNQSNKNLQNDCDYFIEKLSQL